MWKRYVARQLVPHDITPKQIFVLRQLRAHESLTPSAIADLLYADRPTTAAMLRCGKLDAVPAA